MSSSNEKSVSPPNTGIEQILGIDRKENKLSKAIRWSVIGIVILAVAIVLFQVVGNNSSQSVRYTTTPATRGDMTITVTATGKLEPVNQVEIGAEISGTIESVEATFNDRVKQGQVLARMNTDQLTARVSQAKAALALALAQVKQAEATVKETGKKLQRSKELAKTGMCSEENCDAAQAGYDRAVAELERTKAQVVQAQASLDAEQTSLAKATIHSPIDGIVLKRDVEPGQTVAASFQTPVLFTLAESLTRMELHVDVDEADVGQVKEGQDAEFTVDAYPDKSFPARITEVHFASQTVDGVVTYETVLRVDNSGLLLRPGMTATADIRVKQLQNALLVPNAALRFTPGVQQQQASSDRGLIGSLLPRRPRQPKQRNTSRADTKQQQLWIVRGGQPVAIPVAVGATNGILTEITSGDVEPGTELIVDTASREK